MKKIKLLSVSLLFALCTMVSGQNKKYQDIKLWESGYTVTNGKEKEMKDGVPVSAAEMRVYPVSKDKANGKAVIILPGGGYSHLAVNHEGYDFAPFFNNEGITVCVLKYRMPFGNRAVPFADVEEAMRIVKENASEWNIDVDKIGVMGSAAGGHLASTYATKCKEDLAPAFQILLYPVISMHEGVTHNGSRRNLLGEEPSKELIDSYSNHNCVTDKTPRAFIALSNDDKAVIPENGINYYLALSRCGVDAWVNVYPTGGHGWGNRDNFKYKTEFISSLREWLRSF